MISFEQVQAFCNEHNYDMRTKANSSRWIDQKCTPDVVWSISDFISNYVEEIADTFTVKQIWQSEYAKQSIRETFSKPDTDEASAEREYDKVFSQPMAMLCYAGVLEDISTTTRHIYRVANEDVLEYIARNDNNALRFLQCYIEKALVDSGLFHYFADFFEYQDKIHFTTLKDAFVRFYHDYTPVEKDYEPKRIFTKVLNPLAHKYVKKGTERGHISSDVIVKSDMMYNRDNFRDVYADKPKGTSRQEWLQQHPELDVRTGYFEQQMNHAKRTIRRHIKLNRDNVSELTMFVEGFEENTNNMQVELQMHHIFPKNEFPAIMEYYENLIALTPNQHYGYAHPNNTQIIDVGAQKTLLIAKTYSIKMNIERETDVIFEFSKFLEVLSEGWSDASVLEIADRDYDDVIHSINYHYTR